MKRIAILGGGISGLTAAYELEKARKRGAGIDWHLYEATDRLGGIISTTRYTTSEGEFILEDGPDGWVSEKPWARELVIELGLEDQLIDSNDATRKTYILREGKLEAIPDRMRMMVPEDLSALDDSPLFSEVAKQAYAAEPGRAEELKAQVPGSDESVASFVRRHFADEVLTTLAAPLLSGVFGGDVHKLSVRAVMPQFVALEREYGSLILGLRAKATKRKGPAQPIFTSLRKGMGSLVDALVATLPKERIHFQKHAHELLPEVDELNIDFASAEERTLKHRLTTVLECFDHVIVATPLDQARELLAPLDSAERTFLPGPHSFSSLAPTHASSAVLAAFTWPRESAETFDIPQGFGFLVPPGDDPDQLLACTFVDQKFPSRAPEGARILRAFFGGAVAADLTGQSDHAISQAALRQLRKILGPIPEPAHAVIHRLPRSLPQYEVGHLDRIEALEELISRVPTLSVLGNSYRGVGIPDLIRDARAATRKLIANAQTTPAKP